MLANEAFFIIAQWHNFVSPACDVGTTIKVLVQGPGSDFREMSADIAILELGMASLPDAIQKERKKADDKRLRADMDIISSMIMKEHGGTSRQADHMNE